MKMDFTVFEVFKMSVQEILRQFEFWPLKRRLDRARYNLAENLESEETQDNYPQSFLFLSKVTVLNDLT
jgi:hypothetical protein